MRLDWNDIKARASKFADDWKDASREKSESQSFYNAFFDVFGVQRRRYATFEHAVNLPGNTRGYLDVFWKGKLLVEQKTAGRDLKPAREQAKSYFPGLKDYELPRYILLSDFQNFELYDLEDNPDEPLRFMLSNLPDHVQAFGFMVGQERRIFRDQDPVNVVASEMMGDLHDQLLLSGYKGHELERFLVRLLFCLFADDTGIFQPLGLLEDYIKERTQEDGSDLGSKLTHLFQVLNEPEIKRAKTLDADLGNFPYINGDLFGETLAMPSFNRGMRDKLLEACAFHWQHISPAIFGALFQSVLKKDERRKKGAHYTSEKNILKVIGPLFLDDLKTEFERLKARRDTGRAKALKAFQEKLASLTFFDPACGCGNFLVIAYRELRELETETLKEIRYKSEGTLGMFDVASMAQVNVNQFYGIEIEEFPARIAEVAMWMMDHIMNARLSAAFGESYLRIPLKTSPNVRHGDALEIDWADVLAPEKCSYVFGNPPFVGAKVQSETQRAQVRALANLGGSGGTLDFVCAWFLKAGAYVQGSSLPSPHSSRGEGVAPRIAFVATNSITQGEQVAQLWPLLFERYGLEIAFGHRTFEWMSDARGKAHVHCVIIGLTRREDEPKEKRLFSYEDIAGNPVESRHAALSPYLFDAAGVANKHLVVDEASRSIGGAKRMIIGSKPIDGGYYIFDEAERTNFLAGEPASNGFLHPYIGSEEFINGETRYILALQNATPSELRALPAVVERMKLVSRYRRGEILSRKDIAAGKTELKKRSKHTIPLASNPQSFHVNVLPTAPFLVIPKVSSERREYVPIGWLEPPTIPSDLVFIVKDASLAEFALITSRMHMAWLRNIGGRLKSDYRYSIGIVYNNFPWPEANDKQREKTSALAQAVLDTRANHQPGSTLADLYDPDTMPADLRKAHTALDKAVDQLYRREPFANDRERVEHLFALYEKLSAPILAAAGAKSKGGKGRS